MFNFGDKLDLFFTAGRSQRSGKRGFRGSQYKKSYDPYDSNEEYGGGCPDCQHSDKHIHGKHSDCCPRYIDNNLAMERSTSDNENDLESFHLGTSPRQRSIKPLLRPGQDAEEQDDHDQHRSANLGESEQEMSEEGDYLGADYSRSVAGESTMTRTRAQSARSFGRNASHRASNRMYKITIYCLA